MTTQCCCQLTQRLKVIKITFDLMPNNNCQVKSLPRRPHAQALTDATPPIGKIHQIRKNANKAIKLFSVAEWSQHNTKIKRVALLVGKPL